MSNGKPQLGYCLIHETSCWTDDLQIGPECVLVFCEPPDDHRLNWDAQDEPAPDELAAMDENALSLLADFELEK